MKPFRNENILQSIIDGTSYEDPSQSRMEDLLLQLKEVIEQGGGGSGGDATPLTTAQMNTLLHLLDD